VRNRTSAQDRHIRVQCAWIVRDACATEIKTVYSGVTGTMGGRAWHGLLNAVKSAFEKMGKDAFASEESS